MRFNTSFLSTCLLENVFQLYVSIKYKKAARYALKSPSLTLKTIEVSLPSLGIYCLKGEGRYFCSLIANILPDILARYFNIMLTIKKRPHESRGESHWFQVTNVEVAFKSAHMHESLS